jgi:preprotein translocase subunit SecA
MNQIKKSILLQLLDQTWKEHLLSLDYLRQGIVLRAYGQKDPLNEYRAESFGMFEGMLDSLREKVTNAICMIELHADQPEPAVPQPRAPQKTILSRGDTDPFRSPELKPYEAPAFDPSSPETWARTPRNAACPCGSGKKYKYCHGKAAWG